MFIDEQATSSPNSFIGHLMILVMALVLSGVLVLAGCDSNGAAEPESQIEDIAISPDDVSLAAGESVDFEVVALTASGDTVQNANLNLTWWSTNSTVFTVENDGTATGQEPGTALCKVEATEETASKVTKPFTGRDSVFVSVF